MLGSSSNLSGDDGDNRRDDGGCDKDQPRNTEEYRISARKFVDMAKKNGGNSDMIALLLRHNLDVMHIEKNICESIIGTLLHVKGKSKDGLKSRKDLKDMCIRNELHPQERGNNVNYLPPAPHMLSKTEKQIFCKRLANLKLPDGYSSNISNCISLEECKIVGLKSHDCHVLLHQLLSVALRGLLPKGPRNAIFRLCAFYNEVCQRVIDRNRLEQHEEDVIETMCMFERFFPPSFFDIMVHLTIHIGREARLGGPVQYRWMYPFERENGNDDVTLKILFCGVCHSDLHYLKNEWGITMFPLVPGHEIVGIVTKIGSNVEKFKVGDRVGVGVVVSSCKTCENCQQDLENYCRKAILTYNSIDHDGTKTYGGYSDLVVVDQRYVLRFPDNLPSDSGAPLLCAGITVYSPMKYYGMTEPGKHLGVAGLGGLGHVAVKLGKAFRLKVTVISSSPHKEAEAINRLGADSFLVTRDPAQMKAALGTMDYIIDTVSAVHPLAPLLGLLKLNGKLVTVGLPDRPLELPIFPLVLGRKLVGGSDIGGMKETQEMLDFCAKHNITADIELIKMDDINKAFERLAKSDVRYRFVIDVGNSLSKGPMTSPRISGIASLTEFTKRGFSRQTNLILPPAKQNLGYEYSSGVWQFEGYGYVPHGTSGVCIMQVFGANPPHATTLMLRVYNGSLMYYRGPVLVPNIYDKWFHLNVIHDVGAAKVKVFIDGYLLLQVDGRGGTTHSFKCGVYAQNNDSYCMESRWKDIKVLRKCD
ncbi:hypothetical protein L1049_002141 [Liquidambar formosana]|uniref:Enoyl reductase (ER) domain-containing protein n=1 Tax=Liquidambar formosana TaxID=63359 RepID=A0AAP0NGR7_LIQFO